MLSADAERLQGRLQNKVQGALDQLQHANELLALTQQQFTPDEGSTAALDELLEKVIRQQNEIAEGQEVLAEMTSGGTGHTMNLGITQGIRAGATQRFEHTPQQDHNQQLYYERTVQTLEQQLLEFRRNLDEFNDPSNSAADDPEIGAFGDLGSDAADRYELEVARYMRRCKVPTTEELISEQKSYTEFQRKVHLDVLGIALFIIFLVTVVGYIYVRIVYSIRPLGTLIPYGIVILVIEMVGAIAIIFYGIWLLAKPDNSDVNRFETAPTLRREYHIRVLVPCYSEPLAIVQRTVLAARRALVPPGCKVTIYLCDDGKKADKRMFVDSLKTSEGPEVVYVTGRKRTAGKTLNGKSENLNHCLKLIYPDDRGDDEVPNIPLGEVMCLFDADQSCSRTFFTSLMPYMDSGDNVAVALSPQLMFNVEPNMDIFNHQNVHFWEKMQPGMDALGFISLTGTNMILRCRALQDCGWFPVDSVTEDWELGMRMKKWGWVCRYVQQYNAIGEAPDEVRQCFQQRSRWCKGHFQTFWSNQCPLVDRRLGLLFQLCYSSTCLSYISAAVAVPTMTLVPVVTLLFGYFPIALNLPTVMAISCYYVSLHALTFYSSSAREFRALWLANIGTTILFWPYAKAAFFTPLKQFLGKGLTFKATSKGAKKDSVSLKEIGPSLLLTLLSALAFLAGISDFDVNVNAPKAIALCWVVYNAVPHFLLIVYARFGSGKVLLFCCNWLMWIQMLLSLLALILLWLLYPREENYVRALDLSLEFVQAQVSGAVTQPYQVDWRMTSGTENLYTLGFTGPPVPGGSVEQQTTTVVDLSGGFYTDGEVGPVKITLHVAATTSMLAWSLMDYKDWWAKDNKRLLQALEIVAQGLAYVNSAYVVNPIASPGDTSSDLLVYQVGDIRTERMLWRRPEDLRSQQPMLYVTAGESPADLAGQMSAAISAGALALYTNGRMDPATTGSYINRAHRLFTSAMVAPTTYTRAANTTSDSAIEDHYPSNSYLDDLFWASTWLLRSTQRDNGGFRFANASYYYSAMRMTMDLAFAERDSMAVSLDYMNNVALVHAAVITRDWKFHSAAQSWIWDWICSGDVTYTTFGRAFHPESMMLGDTALAAAIAAVYVHGARQWNLASKNDMMMTGFHCFAEGQGRLLLGVNYRKPMITGFNARDYKKLWHRGASCPRVPAPCDISTVTANEEDLNDLNGALIWLPGKRDVAPDVRGLGGENGTVVSLDNNIAVPLLYAALADRSQYSKYMDCLQGQGRLLKHPVCRYNRPLGTRLGPDHVPVLEVRMRFRGLYSPADGEARAPPPPPPVPADEFDTAPLDPITVANDLGELEDGANPAAPGETPVAPVAPVGPADGVPAGPIGDLL